MDCLNEQRMVGAAERISEDIAEIKWVLQSICNNVALLNEGKATGKECMYQSPKAKEKTD